jgi:hypothetical protein
VCAFYRFAHIDGRIGSTPAQYVRRTQVHPSDTRRLDRSEVAVFGFTAGQYDRDHAALGVLLGLNGLASARRARPEWRTSASSGATARPPVGGASDETLAVSAVQADPRTTTIYDRRRQNLDHATYVVVAFVVGG